MSILIQRQAKAHPQMFYIILVCSTVLNCDFVHFIPYACALGVMLHGIDIGAERSMPVTPTPTPTHYRYRARAELMITLAYSCYHLLWS